MRAAANARTPIFMAHGTRDGVVPIARGRDSCELLRQLGHPVEWHEYPMEHSVSLQEIQDLDGWLSRILAAP